MTTPTTTTPTYTIDHDPMPDGYSWHVMEGGEAVASFETEMEAIEDRAARHAEAEAEEREDRLMDLRYRIEVALQDVDDERKLQAILTLISG
jgi:hypothetical protein